ncbi:glycosyltransferase [bacterium]|nr:glycosyltransferase [bacterium]MBU1615873.1 glycosyltransferase [bacterium]
MNPKYVNITMVTYNRLEYTQKSIASIIDNTVFPYVLTVVDNGSADGTQAWLRKQKRRGIIKNLILHPENKGYAYAANDGWEAEDSDYYVKVDNDIIIQKKGWLSGMIEAIDNCPEVGVIAYNFEQHSYPIIKIGGYKLRVKVGNLGGCCVLIPKRTYQLLGYWCEEYGLYGEEDGDYGFRIKLAGLLNCYMEDENIGLHLPDGRAAIIDDALNIISSEDERYKTFKNEQRKLAVKRVAVNFEAYRIGLRPLYMNRGQLQLPEHPNLKIAVLLHEGDIFLRRKNYKEAIELFNQAISFDIKDKELRTRIFFQKGRAYFNQKKYQESLLEYKEAEKELKKALSLEPFNKDLIISVHYAMGSNYERQGRLNEAIGKFRHVVRNEVLLRGDKFAGGAHFHLGCIYKELGKEKEKAKHHFKECLKFIPNHKKAKEYLEVASNE